MFRQQQEDGAYKMAVMTSQVLEGRCIIPRAAVTK